MSERGTLWILCGLARSGKSTYCEKWQQFRDDETLQRYINNALDITVEDWNPKPRVVLCMDKLRLALYGTRYNGFCEGLISWLKPALLRMFLDAGYDVMSDGTNTTVSSLKKLFAIDPGAKVVFLNTSPEICKQRAKDTGQSDLDVIIDRMYNNLKEMWEEYSLDMSYGYNDLEFDMNDTEEWNKIFDRIRAEVTPTEHRIV
jgi:predicted kinase